MTAAPGFESWSRVTPFGVRFLDDYDGATVTEGLSVTGWPTQEPSRARALPRNGSDVFYLMDVPGLRDLEFGAGDDAYWATLPRQLAFTFEVNDPMARFHAFRFSADLPVRGLMRLGCGSPPSALPPRRIGVTDGVPLFSAPTRARMPGTVVIHADLWDAANHVPAAWAVLEARTPNARLRGEPPVRALADHRGVVALQFPIPDERDFDGGSFDSPLGAASAPLGDRTWAVELTAAYGQLAPEPSTATRLSPPIPDLCAALAQPRARLWDRLGATAVEITQTTVHFNQESSLRSSDVGAEPPSVLLLTPESSPP